MDVVAHYNKGDEIALLQPLNRRARFWLSDRVKGTRINSCAVVDPARLLGLLPELAEDGFAVRWQTTLT
jgi:hypothetical protein